MTNDAIEKNAERAILHWIALAKKYLTDPDWPDANDILAVGMMLGAWSHLVAIAERVAAIEPTWNEQSEGICPFCTPNEPWRNRLEHHPSCFVLFARRILADHLAGNPNNT